MLCLFRKERVTKEQFVTRTTWKASSSCWSTCSTDLNCLGSRKMPQIANYQTSKKCSNLDSSVTGTGNYLLTFLRNWRKCGSKFPSSSSMKFQTTTASEKLCSNFIIKKMISISKYLAKFLETSTKSLILKGRIEPHLIIREEEVKTCMVVKSLKISRVIGGLTGIVKMISRNRLSNHRFQLFHQHSVNSDIRMASDCLKC